MEKQFIEKFNMANGVGIIEMNALVATNSFASYDLSFYYKKNIIFKPEFDKLDVITLFLDKLNALK